MPLRLDPTKDAELLAKLGVTVDKPKKQKYGNRRFERDGLKWDSEHEYWTWIELKDELRRGNITSLKRQVRFPFYRDDVKVGTFVCDFVITVPGSDQEFMVDAKSAWTCRNQAWRRMVRHVEAEYKCRIWTVMKGESNAQQTVVQIKETLINST